MLRERLNPIYYLASIDKHMSIKRNIILIDFDASPKWEMGAVLSEITKEDWNIAKCVTNKYHKNKFDSLKRIFLYFFFPLTIVIKRKKYDKIIYIIRQFATKSLRHLCLQRFCQTFCRLYITIYIAHRTVEVVDKELCLA